MMMVSGRTLRPIVAWRLQHAAVLVGPRQFHTRKFFHQQQQQDESPAQNKRRPRVEKAIARATQWEHNLTEKKKRMEQQKMKQKELREDKQTHGFVDFVWELVAQILFETILNALIATLRAFIYALTSIFH